MEFYYNNYWPIVVTRSGMYEKRTARTSGRTVVASRKIIISDR